MNTLTSKIIFDVLNPFRPFIEKFGDDDVRCVMFMGVYKQHNESIFLYKNNFTRKYINISENGCLYRWNGLNETYEVIK